MIKAGVLAGLFGGALGYILVWLALGPIPGNSWMMSPPEQPPARVQSILKSGEVHAKGLVLSDDSGGAVRLFASKGNLYVRSSTGEIQRVILEDGAVTAVNPAWLSPPESYGEAAVFTPHTYTMPDHLSVEALSNRDDNLKH